MPGVAATAMWLLALVPAKRSRPSIPLARTQDGGTRWINVSILALPAAADGEAALVLHLCRDATDLKRNEQMARQALALLQSWQQPAQPRAIHTIPTPLSPLTEREQEVLELMAEGKSTDRIAVMLSISRATARNHIQNILQKLHVHSRAEAVAYAFEHGLLGARMMADVRVREDRGGRVRVMERDLRGNGRPRRSLESGRFVPRPQEVVGRCGTGQSISEVSEDLGGRVWVGWVRSISEVF